jgi:hypothetical protein
MSILERHAPKFRAADTDGREKIVETAADYIERNWREDAEFDRDTIISVCHLSPKLGHSQILLVYSQTSVWQTQTGF